MDMDIGIVMRHGRRRPVVVDASGACVISAGLTSHLFMSKSMQSILAEAVSLRRESLNRLYYRLSFALAASVPAACVHVYCSGKMSLWQWLCSGMASGGGWRK